MADQGPLSPHLQIYRWQMTSVLSILHRASGLLLAVAFVLLVVWLVAAALGETAFAAAQALFGSAIGRLILFFCTLAGAYHALNGLRHLAWDCGWGFALPNVHRTGWIVAVASAVITLAAWIAVAQLNV